MKWLTDRLSEPSTWTGIIGIAVTTLGVQLAPEQAETIATAVASVAGVVLVLIKEHRG